MSSPEEGLKLLLAANHVDLIVNAVPRGGKLLEYGAGGSTLEFANKLWADAELCSIEHDRRWADLVATEMAAVRQGAVVRVYHAPMRLAAGYNGTPREEEPLEGTAQYVHAADIRGPFDVVFIDGVCRNDCLRNARDVLKPRGIVFLHDAERSWYDSARAEYETLGEAIACGGYGHDRIKLWWGRPK